MLAAVIGLYVVTSASEAFDAGTFDFRAIVDAVATGKFIVQPGIANVAVPRLHVRLRGQGPAVAVPPLAARRRGRRPRRPRAVLMMAVMDKVGTFGMLRYCLQLFPDAATYFRPIDHHAGRHRDRLRRDPGHRPDRRDAADRLHLDQPLRLHHPRHLRDDQPGSVRLDAVHGQPRHLDGRAVPDRRLPGRRARHPRSSPPTAGSRRSRRSWPAPSWSPVWRRCRCPAWRRSSANSWS